MVENLAQLQNRKSILGIKSNRKEIDESHLHRRQIEGEARIAVPPLRADAGEPLPDPRRRPRHDLRCSNSTDHKHHPVAGATTVAIYTSKTNKQISKSEVRRGTRRGVVEGGGAVGAGEPAHGDEGTGAPVHLAGVTATLLWPPPLNLA